VPIIGDNPKLLVYKGRETKERVINQGKTKVAKIEEDRDLSQ